MEQTSRPATAADLKRVVSALNASGAHYLLIGAYALFAHGYQRATTDIDFVVEGTHANGQRGQNIRVADEITVDLLFSPCAQTYDMLKAYEQIIDLDGVPVRTVSLEGLLLTKQSQRPQDIQDALILRRAIEASR